MYCLAGSLPARRGIELSPRLLMLHTQHLCNSHKAGKQCQQEELRMCSVRPGPVGVRAVHSCAAAAAAAGARPQQVLSVFSRRDATEPRLPMWLMYSCPYVPNGRLYSCRWGAVSGEMPAAHGAGSLSITGSTGVGIVQLLSY